MNESVSIYQEFANGLLNIATQAVAYLPKVIVAVVLLVLGWLLARLMRLLIIRGISHLDHMWHSLFSKDEKERPRHRRRPPRIAGELVFWLLILVFITLAGEILGIDVFSVWLKEIFTFLPTAASGLAIVFVGFIVSSLTRDLVLSAADTAELSHGDLLARTAQLVILFIAVILGIDQIGLDIFFLTVIAGIVLATMLGGLALAFGLGAQVHVSNIIAANELRKIYHTGDNVRIGDVEGRVLDITLSRVIIENETGTVDVPAKIFDEEVTIIVEKGS